MSGSENSYYLSVSVAHRRNIAPNSTRVDPVTGVQNENSDGACVKRKNCRRRTVTRLQYHSSTDGRLAVTSVQATFNLEDTF